MSGTMQTQFEFLHPLLRQGPEHSTLLIPPFVFSFFFSLLYEIRPVYLTFSCSNNWARSLSLYPCPRLNRYDCWLLHHFPRDFSGEKLFWSAATACENVLKDFLSSVLKWGFQQNESLEKTSRRSRRTTKFTCFRVLVSNTRFLQACF